MWQKSKETKTLKSKVLVIMVGLVVFQIASILCVLLLTDTNEKLDSNNVQILSNSVNYKGISFEREMLRWSDFSEWIPETDKITEHMEAESGRPIHLDIENGAFRRGLLDELSDSLLANLRDLGTTGAFIILSDGTDSVLKDSVYLRDLNPNDTSESNHDILVEAGLGDRSLKKGFTLDSYWSQKLKLDENRDFYEKPMQAALNFPGMEAVNLGYWSGTMRLRENDIPVITYTVPLLDSAHIPYGVMGIELSLDYLSGYLDGLEISIDKNASYFLGRQISDENGCNVYETVFVDNVYYQRKMAAGTSVAFCHRNNRSEVCQLSVDGLQTSEDAYFAELNLYKSNTPFSSEEWIVAGIVEDVSLYSSSRSFMMVLAFALGISLAAGIIGAFFVTSLMFAPLHSMMEGLKHVSLSNSSLPRTGIVEVDELAVEIERLRHNAFQAGSKVADIIDMSNISLGIFEYHTTIADDVFCTKKFFELTQLPMDGWNENYMHRSKFFRLLKEFRGRCIRSEDNPDICYFTTREGSSRYLEIKSVENNNQELYIYMDVTAQILEKEKIKHERDYDVLTNLFNRRAFVRKVSQLIEEQHIAAGVLSMWDLDNLKFINDTYGHDMGDKYICMLAEEFKSLEYGKSVTARISGDEFMVFLYGGSVEEMEQILQKLHAAFQKRKIVLPDGETLLVSASAGIAVYRKDADNYEELVKLADFTMYEVKHHEKGNIQCFNRKTYERDYILVQGIGELKKLLDEELIHYVFQPIIDIKQKKVFAYEALMRPDSEILCNPELLLRVAEHQSKLRQIEKLTWFHALEEFSKQKDASCNEKLFLNSIPNQILTDEEFADLKQRYGTYLSRVVMEITEQAKQDRGMEARKEYFCNSLCIEIALDDYGAGYSTNAVLINGGFHYVKIDISMIREIHLSEEKQVFVKGVIEYCHHCNTRVIVEGVETEEEYHMVEALGANYVQGYYFSRPVGNISEIEIDFAKI